jgi:hypothetical protein
MAGLCGSATRNLRLELYLLSDPAVSWDAPVPAPVPAGADAPASAWLEAIVRRERDLLDDSWIRPGPGALRWEVRALSRTAYEEVHCGSDANRIVLEAYRRGARLVDPIPADPEDVRARPQEWVELGRYVLALSEGRGISADPLV